MKWIKISHWKDLPQEECGKPFLVIYDNQVGMASYDGYSNYYLTLDPREAYVFALYPIHIYFQCYMVDCTEKCKIEHLLKAKKLTHCMQMPELPTMLQRKTISFKLRFK